MNYVFAVVTVDLICSRWTLLHVVVVKVPAWVEIQNQLRATKVEEQLQVCPGKRP